MADEEDHVPHCGCDPSCGVCSYAVRSQIVLPVLRSSAITTNLCDSFGPAPRGSCDVLPFSTAGTAVSTNTLSPQITGVPDPRPGISTFQRTFFVSLHSMGGSAVFETPVPDRPRPRGQYSSDGVQDPPCPAP